MVLIGSQAIKYHFPDFNRVPLDWDYVVTEKLKNEYNTPRIEFHINPIFDNYPDLIINPNDLYTLKLSHTVIRDINFNKHVYDIQFLRKKGCVLNYDLFYKLYDYWLNVINDDNVSLKRPIGDFLELSHEEKCNLVREEIYSMTLQKYPDIDYRVGYSRMLKDYILYHTPLEISLFIIENFIELHKPKFNFINERK